jgi:hypothetical protein
VAAAITAAAALLLPAGAVAHEPGIPTVAVLDRVAPSVRGLHVRVVQSVSPAMEVRNATGRDLEVVGPSGEPFLRFNRGLVQRNTLSPAAAASTDPLGLRPRPSGLDATAPPMWTTVATSDTWRWFDPRLHAPAGSRWIVPLRAGSRDVLVSGHIERLGEHGHLRTVLDRISPKPPGLELRVLEGRIPALFVRNTTSATLEVPGDRGEPFLRIGPGGVSGNERSPSYYLAGSREIRPVPPEADPAAEPQWVQLSAQPVWAWLEYRARVPGNGREPFVLGPRRRTVLRWTTPAMLGAEPLRVAGHVEWVPARAKAARAWWPVPAAIAGGVLLVALGVGLRRRPGAGSRSPAPAP